MLKIRQYIQRLQARNSEADSNRFLMFVSVVGIWTLYFPLIGSSFQQDEWHIGWYIDRIQTYGIALWIWKIILSQQNILLTIFSNINYHLFGINNTVPAIVLLSTISLNIVILFRFFTTLTKSRWIACGTVLFGYTSVTALQSVTWVLPAVGIQASVFFSVLALQSTVEYMRSHSVTAIIRSVLYLFIAFLWKSNSISIAIYVLLLIGFHIVREETNRTKFLKHIRYILPIGSAIGLIFFFVILRSIIFRFAIEPSQIFMNIVLIPIKAISQLIIAPSWMYELALFVSSHRYGNSLQLLHVYNAVTELLSFSIGCLLLFIFTIFFKYLRSSHKRLIIALLVFICVSFIPNMFDMFSTGTGYLESRYYVYAAIAIGSVMSIFVHAMLTHLSGTKRTIIRNLGMFCMLIGLGLYGAANIMNISSSVIAIRDITRKRIEVLDFLKQSVVQKSNGTFVLYLREIDHLGKPLKNHIGYLMQTGLLYPLLVYSYDTKMISSTVFRDNTIWDSNFQGIHISDRGTVGLFYEKSKLVESTKSNPSVKSNIYLVDIQYLPVTPIPNSFGEEITNLSINVRHVSLVEDIQSGSQNTAE